ncbi:MAG TPA: hypothetical protein PLP46_02535 [bacterium]|jgi:hypothetical protein|nr:hypothetical protein [bacterium]HNZ51653.1 hypothetical protein [bacterium]HOF79796.1 hypothetical protein [bacterium]HOH85674.1 hypothetical protein [bacterium]HOQ91953.1 hypothetical protein [bacterium]
MADILKAKHKTQKKSSKMFWLILAIAINSAGLFLVVRWYGQFTDNQRPLTDIDETAFKVFTDKTSDNKTISPGQRQLLKTNLSKQTVEEFLSLSLLTDPKFKNLQLNYQPVEVATTTDGETADDLNGLVIGNPRPFRY